MTTVHPTPRPRSRRGAAAVAITSAAVAAALAACGGGAGDDAATSNAPAASSTVTTTRSAPLAPLVDDRGRPLLSSPSAAPADTAARTRQGLYASRGQLEWEELTVGIVSVVLDVDVEGGVDATVHRARGLRAWHGNDGIGRVYYVRAHDLSAAARVVDRLSDEGFGWVYMVH